MTSDETALLAGVLADPNSDVPRLVYADWLEENGDTDRAEFIRLQCEQANHEDRHPDKPFPHLQRIAELFQKLSLEQVMRRSGQFYCGFGCETAFYRGFIGRVLFSSAFAIQQFSSLVASHPIQQLMITELRHNLSAEEWRSLATTHQIAHVRKITFHLGSDSLVREFIATATSLRLTALHLEAIYRFPSGLRLLNEVVDKIEVGHLKSLTFTRLSLPPSAAFRLAQWPGAVSLQMLDVSENQIGDTGAQHLAASPYLEHIERLIVGRNLLSQTGRNALKKRFGKRVKAN